MTASRDLKNNLSSDLAFFKKFTGNDSLTGYILDTAHYDDGIMFSFAVPDRSGGTVTLKDFKESDDSAMAGSNDIADNNLIGSLSGISIPAKTNVGDPLPTIGIIGTKRYVQMNINTSGAATVVVTTSKMSEYKPVTQI